MLFQFYKIYLLEKSQQLPYLGKYNKLEGSGKKYYCA